MKVEPDHNHSKKTCRHLGGATRGSRWKDGLSQQIAHLLGGSKLTGPSRASPSIPYKVSEMSPRNQFRADDDNLRIGYAWGRSSPGDCSPPLPTTNIRDEGGLRLSSLIGSLIKMCLDFGCGLMVEHLSLSHPQQCGGGQ